MTPTCGRLLKFFYLLSLATSVCLGQVTTGTPPFGSFGGGPFDTVNLANLNVHFGIPVVNKAGRGIPFTYTLSYDSSIWTPVAGAWQPVQTWGWRGVTEIATGYLTSKQTTVVCDSVNLFFSTTFSSIVYHDALGIPHPFGGTARDSQDCPPPYTTFDLNSNATDGSGYKLFFSAHDDGATRTITQPSGRVTIPPYIAPVGAGTTTDSNGNQITMSNTGVATDTLNTTAITVTGSGTPASPIRFTYTAPSGSAVAYVANYTNFNVKTNFTCTGISQYTATNIPLVTSIALPDSSQYTFTYEPTPSNPGFYTGRLASVTLPTGGVITYSYTGANNGIICADGSAAGLTRTLNPGGTWTYVRNQVSGPHWTTTITDPATPTHNQTLIDFEGIYESQRAVYQGSIGGTPLRTTIACYNASGTPAPATCPAAAITLPIARVTTFQYLSTDMHSETDTTYDSFGLVKEVDESDFGTAPPPLPVVRKTITTYKGGLSNGIVDRPETVVVKDGGNVLQASTTYGYDETGVVSSGVTQQHVSIIGSRGNLTTVNAQVNGTTNLYRKFAYYDTGSLSTSTDLSTNSVTNGPTTTYNYTAGTASCNNAFVTSITEPLSLSRSMTWNCTGGVLLSVTDENSKISSTSYTDSSFWRPASVTDQGGYVTSVSYLSPTRTETALTFSSSTVDHLTQLDAFGRPIVSQTRQAPASSSYDSVETDYDVVGQVSKVTLPYSGVAGALCSGACPGTIFASDALGRSVSATDGGGGSTSYSYTKNDVYQTLGPAPVSENAKRKQVEYDGLGRLKSVCEISSATGSGNCTQSTSATGFLTGYTYNTLGLLTNVSQGVQARTYGYDMLGRLVTETNPESGTTSYFYESSSPCVAFAGALVKKTDGILNSTCYSYDLLRRLTGKTYSGPNLVNQQGNSYYVYDAATVNGVVMANAKARLAEAYTATTPTGTKITDLGFSYTARGEPATLLESTPHSGGYYTLSATYWASGAPNTLSGLGLPTITYNSDGEGRSTTVSASSGQNPVTGTSYNVSSQVTGVTLGSLDVANFGFDANTGRQNLYNEVINGSVISGSLTWNANATLKQLVVADAFNAGDNQTCNYAYDDLARLVSANCGAPWSQTFTYDAFGNLTKSGSWAPGYTAATNRYAGATTYDANGNLLTDTFHTYKWNVENRPTGFDTITLIHDALGRIVEKNNGGVYNQYVYDPSGQKLATMSGPTLFKALVSLPGGIQAVFSPTASFYRVPDWLGSARIISSTTRTFNTSEAFAPFGERYALGGSAPFVDSFTGLTNSTVSDEYDFPARSMQTNQGRWISPDPAGLAAVNPADPQSWNRYSYVGNRPLNSTDPLGLVTCLLCGDGDGGPGWCDAFDPFCGIPCGFLNPCGDPCNIINACEPSGGGSPPGGGGPAGGGPAPRVGGKWPNGETLGLPTGLNLKPMGLADLIGLAPGTQCDFGVCNPIGNGLLSGIGGLGTPDAPFTIDVLVLAPFLQSILGSGSIGGVPIRPFTLQFPNVPPGSACSKYASRALRFICNKEPNSPTNNCTRGYLLGRYDPNSGYQGGRRGAHCESFAACGMSPWNPAQIAFGCYLY